MTDSTSSSRGTRVGEALRQLRELIVKGRLAPGSRVVEADLAKMLGVSRTPVRDALRYLLQEGFIIAPRYGGAKTRLVVAPLTKEDAQELYWIVGHVEGLAARLTAQLDPDKRAGLVRHLKHLNNGLQEVAESGRQEPGRILELDMSFHRKIIEASAGPRLLAIHNSIKPQTERYWRLYAGAILQRLGTSVTEHEAIMNAVEEGDPDGAERAIRLNWENGANRLCHVIDTLGERGSWHLSSLQEARVR